MIIRPCFDLLRRLASTATVHSSRPLADFVASRLLAGLTPGIA